MRRFFTMFLGLVACGGSSASTSSSPPGDPAPTDTPDTTATPASDSAPMPSGQCAGYTKYKKAFFGNLHQHTSYSLDAYGFGTRATPADAYAFAKGTIGIDSAGGGSGKTFIDRPLDFLGVTDHSEWLGVQQTIAACKGPGDGSDQCKTLLAQEKTAWDDEQKAAADALDPCKFTSLIAYEWTSMPDDGSGTNTNYTNHRNVIFGSANVPVIPLDSDTYETPDALFQGLDKQCTDTCAALVIPHNTNLSEGKSLALPDTLTAQQLADMQKYEKLVEIYQHKGSSECYVDPANPEKECSFEYVTPPASGDTPQAYVRTSLANGLQRALDTGGGNPLAMGIISSTDDHNALAGLVNETLFQGHLGTTDATPVQRLEVFPDFGPGGLAAVWAEENTRDAVYGALNRRETFGTSGPRIQVRFFETANPSPCTGDFPATIVDGGAVPMGGTFKAGSVAAGAAHFAIAAWPDDQAQPLADGSSKAAGLDKAQVIKVHGKAGGKVTQDRPVDVSLAKVGGCVPWTDASYDPSEQSFYYVRVLQEPTFRWSHFDCQTRPGASGCEAGGALDVTIQERAWTSPIWSAP